MLNGVSLDKNINYGLYQGFWEIPLLTFLATDD